MFWLIKHGNCIFGGRALMTEWICRPWAVPSSTVRSTTPTRSIPREVVTPENCQNSTLSEFTQV
jgi:hypothetical protein